ncbi:MAG: [FeFe] hydrogenase H-cluster maturation GTPase HydF [Candidatus Margulisiibacteriota bacterium]
MSNTTPKGNRAHLAVFGRRNAGKSSFVNAFIDQDLCIVSETPGTTTDPVEKAYELQPFGPILMIDTAGLDDTGELGEKRIKKTREVLNRTDFAFILAERGKFGIFEETIIKLFKENNIPWAIVINKADLDDEAEQISYTAYLEKHFGVRAYSCSSVTGTGIETIRTAVAATLDQNTPPPPLLSDLVKPPELVVLVVPIDKEAPKGRLILPQVQAIRELLDADIPAIVVKDRELHYTLNYHLKTKPKLVVTDSQAFLKVNADVPNDILMTSFSILYARQKGDLSAYVKGVKAIDGLKSGDKVLVAELCSHRPITEDIGRVKIPRWLKQFKGINVDFDYAVGKDFPEDLSPYNMVIQCGGCMVNRQLIVNRIRQSEAQQIPISNYGVVIAYLMGILDRALKPFPNYQL